MHTPNRRGWRQSSFWEFDRLAAQCERSINPTATALQTIQQLVDELSERWGSVAVISKGDVWEHTGVEYDAVVVDTEALTREEIYLGASRAAHELVVVLPA